MEEDDLLLRVQELLKPKVSPEQVKSFFEHQGVTDVEDLSVVMDEAAWMEIGLQRAPARVAIAKIQTHILSGHSAAPVVSSVAPRAPELQESQEESVNSLVVGDNPLDECANTDSLVDPLVTGIGVTVGLMQSSAVPVDEALEVGIYLSTQTLEARKAADVNDSDALRIGIEQSMAQLQQEEMALVAAQMEQNANVAAAERAAEDMLAQNARVMDAHRLLYNRTLSGGLLRDDDLPFEADLAPIEMQRPRSFCFESELTSSGTAADVAMSGEASNATHETERYPSGLNVSDYCRLARVQRSAKRGTENPY